MCPPYMLVCSVTLYIGPMAVRTSAGTAFSYAYEISDFVSPFSLMFVLEFSIFCLLLGGRPPTGPVLRDY